MFRVRNRVRVRRIGIRRNGAEPLTTVESVVYSVQEYTVSQKKTSHFNFQFFTITSPSIEIFLQFLERFVEQ